jgi:hypothetical protein
MCIFPPLHWRYGERGRKGERGRGEGRKGEAEKGREGESEKETGGNGEKNRRGEREKTRRGDGDSLAVLRDGRTCAPSLGPGVLVVGVVLL